LSEDEGAFEMWIVETHNDLLAQPVETGIFLKKENFVYLKEHIENFL